LSILLLLEVVLEVVKVVAVVAQGVYLLGFLA
jgi:hypothetical protein